MSARPAGRAGPVRSTGRAGAVARTWGLGAALAVSLALAGVALVAGDAYVELPVFENRTTVLNALPVLAAMALGFPMVDRWPELTRVAGWSPLRLPVLRLAAVTLVSVPVPLALVAAGWRLSAAAVVLGLVGVAALAVAALGLWYWVPMFGVLVAWVQLRPAYLEVSAGLAWLAGSIGALLLGGAGYVLVEAVRVRRQVSAAAPPGRPRSGSPRPAR